MTKICPVAIIEDFEDVAKIYILRVDDIDNFFNDFNNSVVEYLLANTSFKEDFPDYFSKEGYMIACEKDWCVDIEI